MAELIGIQLNVELAKLTDAEVQKLAKDIETKLRPIKIDLQIDDKALQTIERFNKGMQELANSARQAEKAVQDSTTSSISPTYQKNLEKLKQEHIDVAKVAQKMAFDTKKNIGELSDITKEQDRVLSQLRKTYSITTSEVSKFNNEGKETQRIIKMLDSDMQHMATATLNMLDGTISFTETKNIEKVIKDTKKLEQERQKVLDQINKIAQRGYADSEQLQIFRERATRESVENLKKLSREIKIYSDSLGDLPKKTNLQQTIQSLKTLQKTGAIKLPKKNLISDLETQLKNATTKRELDEIDRRIKRLQKTLTGREQGFLKIERLRADNLLPSTEITKVRERLRKAQSPEQVQLVVTKDIAELERQNRLLKEQQALSDKLARSKDALSKKLVQMHRNQQITTASMERMNRIIEQADSLNRTSRIGDVLFSVENSARIREQTRSLQHYINKTREAAEFRAERLQTQIYGRVSDEDQRTITNILAAMRQITTETPNARRELDRLNQMLTQTTQRVIDADKGFARFAGQLHAAVWRIPIYAAGVAALYTPLRSLRDALRQIIELDTQMTVLERVSNGAINANQALQDSIEIAEKLGNTIAQVNEGLISFARQGYRGADLAAITEVATIMSNVSDLLVEESASSLTATMKAFNIEAEESIRIVDALNEVNLSASHYSNVV